MLQITTTPIETDTTPSYATESERWAILSRQLRAALDVADAHTDFPATKERIKQLRGKVNSADARLALASHPEATASVLLGMFGPNGLLPAIDSVMSSARFHGFNWRERLQARAAA